MHVLRSSLAAVWLRASLWIPVSSVASLWIPAWEAGFLRREGSGNYKTGYSVPFLEAVFSSTSGPEDDPPEDEPFRHHEPSAELSTKMAAVVRQMMRHTWRGYRQKGWPHDDVKPISGEGSDWIGYGVQIIEALDTLFLMGMGDEFREGVAFLSGEETVMDGVGGAMEATTFEPGKLAEDRPPMCTFEIVIRALGGLVGTADLVETLSKNTSKDHPDINYNIEIDDANTIKTLDALSLSVGKKILRYAFRSGGGGGEGEEERVLPYPAVQLSSGQHLDWGNAFFLVEVGSIQLEFRALARRQKDATLSLLPDLTLEMILQSQNGAAQRQNPPGLLGSQLQLSGAARGQNSRKVLVEQGLVRSSLHAPSGGPGKEHHSTSEVSHRIIDPPTPATSPSSDAPRLPLVPSTNPSETTGSVLSFSGRRSLSARSDSYYEYLLKLYLLGGKKEKRLLVAFAKVVADAERELIRVSPDGKSAFLGSVEGGVFVNRMDHLSCFFPGALELAANEALDVKRTADDIGLAEDPDQVALAERWRLLARQLANTCVRMYTENAPYFLAPEYVDFDFAKDELLFDAVRQDSQGRKNLLRPETLESLYYLRYFGGVSLSGGKVDEMGEKENPYQAAGKKIVDAFVKHAKVEFGFSASDTVTGEKLDSQESFFVAETLKYAYLLFAPKEVLSLERFVLSTEAHPMRREVEVDTPRIVSGGQDEQPRVAAVSGDGAGDATKAVLGRTPGSTRIGTGSASGADVEVVSSTGEFFAGPSPRPSAGPAVKRLENQFLSNFSGGRPRTDTGTLPRGLPGRSLGEAEKDEIVSFLNFGAGRTSQ